MEADQETASAGDATPRHKHASSVSTSTVVPSPTTSEHRQRSSSNPHDSSTPKRIDDHDSLVTVRLSEPPRQLTVNTNLPPNGPILNRRSLFTNTSSPGSVSPSPLTSPFNPNEAMSPISTTISSIDFKQNLQDELDGAQDDDSKTISGPEAGDSDGEVEKKQEEEEEEVVEEEEEEEVNWDQLQKTEDEESRESEEDSTAMLLARLEQENNMLATNPKSIKVKAVDRLQQSARKPRPPSMAQLREMVQGPTPAPLRYSMLPPPPMTDLEFYAALVKDYQQTAARLPTLLANKIRKGIPPPLRGVVWQSMSGARDTALEDEFERLTGESSPYEGIIGKDLGRSFASVDMFREPDGEGQRMLGRVLKCYSLYDPKIGYCQGLALLVGPLLIHGLSDKHAFCVLVKLMEQYDLRASFTPDLHGLHVKIYQYRSLLRDVLPTLSAHLDDLQVEPAYVSQWFLSFFAVTLPLPMLFRLYDVIFAEGASETIMRVALSVMRKNEARILACTEMEDVLQLLLSRALWDCYHYNADEFVSDFVALSHVVTRERLSALEQGYRESQVTNPPANTSANAARAASEVTNAASRFLGRLWANSTTSLRNNSPSTNLAPSAASRPLSMLKRSASKQSLASTLNSMDASSTSTSSAASVLSSASTDATSISRDSATDDSSTLGRDSTKVAIQGQTSDSRHLHSQIEDLLTALSDLQRQHALLADQLQREREERDEDRKAVRVLLDGVRAGEALPELLDTLEGRFGEDDTRRRSSITQTKPQMRDDLARTKEQLQNELSKTQDANRRAVDLEQEIATMKDQLRESHAHVRTLHTEKQRLEKQIHGMRVRASDSAGGGADAAGGGITGGWLVRNTSTRSSPGLRELRLGKSQSTPLQMSNRTSSLLAVNPSDAAQPPMSPAENEALLLELAQAKTNEAVARQEADEANQKLERLRKEAMAVEAVAKLEVEEAKQNLEKFRKEATRAESIAKLEVEDVKQRLQQLQKSMGLPVDVTPAPAAQGVMGMFRSFTTPAAETAAPAKPATPVAPVESAKQAATPAATPAAEPAATAEAAPSPAPAAGGGGFWGWRR